MAGYDDGETNNSIPRHHDDQVTTDYMLRKEGQRLLTNCFFNGLTAVGIALLTSLFQPVKAALMNPVKSLRSE